MFNNPVVRETGCWTPRSDILVEKKNTVWEHFVDMFSINISAISMHEQRNLIMLI